VEVLIERLRHRKNRPLLDVADPKAAVERLYGERRDIYETVPHAIIVTDEKKPKDIAKEALAIIIEVSKNDQK